MRRDPTEFRKRFAKWKETGEYSLPRFADGYEAFFNTLPENQKRGSYPTRRYWELNGKPKNFAEAIGRGMYTVLNDNGTLNWHAGSIAYDENADQYEFMKANYHPTRWMELVYGYDQSPEFLKEWKVLYNGPMLSDRYVRREKPGLKIKGGQLPRFATGTEGYKYIQAGKNFDEWYRITDDDMATVFLDFVARPKHRGGNTTEGNWRRLWSLKGEPGLETVSPEFFVISGGLSPLAYGTRNIINTGAKKLADKAGIFVLRPGTYTRGIGMTDAGVLDAIKSGVFRGNPRGTEQTAKTFDKMFLRNRNNFRDIVRDTKIKGIESRYQSRTLTEEDFNALKEASKKYAEEEATIGGGTIRLRRGTADPLSDYKNYQEYIDDVNTTIARTEKMRNRIASGEVQVNKQLSLPMWFEDESGKMFLPQGRPITERFGPNSDYVSDGNPLQYWYADGRNAITKGHPYARSNYMVRVNNPQDYTPFMHELHLHPSFFKTPKLSDPNVELFRRGPFGIVIRMKKPIK